MVLYHYSALIYDSVGSSSLSSDPSRLLMPNLGLHAFALSGPLKRDDLYGFGTMENEPVPGNKDGGKTIDRHGFDRHLPMVPSMFRNHL
jgi:hypothetical protein